MTRRINWISALKLLPHYTLQYSERAEDRDWSIKHQYFLFRRRALQVKAEKQSLGAIFARVLDNEGVEVR